MKYYTLLPLVLLPLSGCGTVPDVPPQTPYAGDDSARHADTPRECTAAKVNVPRAPGVVTVVVSNGDGTETVTYYGVEVDPLDAHRVRK